MAWMNSSKIGISKLLLAQAIKRLLEEYSVSYCSTNSILMEFCMSKLLTDQIC